MATERDDQPKQERIGTDVITQVDGDTVELQHTDMQNDNFSSTTHCDDALLCLRDSAIY